MDIGSRITALLKARRMSQRTLSQKTCLTPSYINQICLNKKIPTIETLERICICLDTDIESFFSSGESGGHLSQDELHLLERYRMLTDSEQQAVLTIIGMLSEK